MKPRSYIRLIFLPLLFAGCIHIRQAAPPTQYYSLAYDAPGAAETVSLPFVIRLEPFAVSPDFASSRISYIEQPYQRSEYAYRKWKGEPGELIAGFLARDLTQSSLFKAVILNEGVPAYSHLLSGKVEAFYQQMTSEPCEAVVSVTITLSSLLQQDIQYPILFQKRYTAREKCLQPTFDGFVEAMSRSVKRISADVLQDVYDALKH